MNTLALTGLLERAALGLRPDAEQALALAGCTDLRALTATAGALRDRGFGDAISYSRKVFVPLTHLCRNSCHYCTFARPPQRGAANFLSPDAVLAIARAGLAAGCKEATFTLGDKPELRYPRARQELERMGYATTLDYVEAMARRVLEETGLLPHLNPGVMAREDMARLRRVSASMGLVLESSAQRLCERGGPHHGSPDKSPAVRLQSLAAAGALGIPMTTGLLIGIGETRLERVQALLALRQLHDTHGHVQEVIVQNFCAKPGTAMAQAPEPGFEEHLWTVAVARIVLGPGISLQAPPNLSAGALEALVHAGINDWGGVSPVTPDHVNPEAPWPQIDALAAQTARAGKVLVERLTVYPRHLADATRWVAPQVLPRVLRCSDASGLARPDAWAPGLDEPLRPEPRHPVRHMASPARARLDAALERACSGHALGEHEVLALFNARGEDFWHVCRVADRLRQSVNGMAVGYVVNRNITYTNVCTFMCQFCAFSKGRRSANLRGRPYDMDLAEIARRAREAWHSGATEVCIQGGIHPSYTGQRYLDILHAVHSAVPEMHVHAFSPLEIQQGAASLGLSVRQFLKELRQAGLGSLPGTAAEILDEEVRRVICPDKLPTQEWLDLVEAAHELGIRSTATIMYGHIEQPVHWARHLLQLRALQARTGGFTEFVPLPFVATQTPMYLKGRSRAGATLREAVLMHAVARLVLHPLVPNVQASWVKMGLRGIELCLNAGANDFGGTLMDESISRSAGASHGQEMSPSDIEAAIRRLDRVPRQRTTLYADVCEERRTTALHAYRSPHTPSLDLAPCAAMA